jgi:hypothetical protein
MLGRERRRAAGLAALQLVEQFGRLRQRALVIEDVGIAMPAANSSPPDEDDTPRSMAIARACGRWRCC